MALEVEKGYHQYGDYNVGNYVNTYNRKKSCWITLKATINEPSDRLALYLPYGVITWSNTYAILINDTAAYPGDVDDEDGDGTGAIPADIADITFESGNGKNPDGSFDRQAYNWHEPTFEIEKKLSAGTYYIHIGCNTTKTGAINILENEATLTVKEIQTYKIQYNANNGTNAPSTSIKKYAEALTLSTTIPTRPGYTFINWNTAADGSGYSYDAGATYTTEADITLYAQWQINTLTIKMAVNGGVKASESLSNMIIIDGIALYDGKSQNIKYGESFYLWNYNNPSQINLRRPGYIISQGKEFCSTDDGTGTTYDQSRRYNTTDFTDITYGSKTITLYVNWKTGGLVYISDGSQWIPYQVYYSNGSSWDHVMPYISNGSEWIQYT